MVLAASVFLACWALSRYQTDADFRAETAYLGLLASLVLGSVAAVARRPAAAPAGAALFAVLALWVLPVGEPRAAVVLALLVGAYLAAAVERLGGQGENEGAGEGEQRPLPWLEAAALAVPLALGAQLLLRGDRLVEPLGDPATLVRVLGLPLAGGAAAALVASRHGVPAAALAAGSVVLLRPGFNVSAALALVALAAGGEAFRPGAQRPRRLLALALLVAPVAWEPRAAIVAAAAGLAAGAGRWGTLAASAVGAAWALALPIRPWPEALAGALWLPVVLPCLLLPAGGRAPALLAALALGVGAARGVPGEAALAAPVALAALSVRREGAVAAAQRAWTAVLFAGTALLASYPWLRQRPLADALGLAGLTPGWAAAVALTGVALGLAAAERYLPFRAVRRPAVAVGAATALALFLALPAPGLVLVRGAPVVLDRSLPEQGKDLERPPVAEILIESRLVHAAGLPPGTRVATLRLRDGEGRAHLFHLEAGRDTGEWAARRPDVRAAGGAAAPPPWRTALAPTGDFFAQTYRARWRLPRRVPAARLEVWRNPELPEEVAVLLTRVELRP